MPDKADACVACGLEKNPDTHMFDWTPNGGGGGAGCGYVGCGGRGRAMTPIVCGDFIYLVPAQFVTEESDADV